MATAHPRIPTRKRVLCTLAATAAATLIGGGGSAIAAPIPTVLNFDAPSGAVVDNDGQGTGFESVQPNKNGSGHLPANLDLTGGLLKVTSTSGDTGKAVNTQANALQVTVDGTGGYTVSALLKGPLPVSTPFQSAGIFVGPDQDNYVKLVAGVGGTAAAPVPRLHVATEIGGVHTQQNVPIEVANAAWIQLILTVTPSGDITASANIDGTITQVDTTSLPALGSASDQAGIVSTSTGTGATPFTASYENFAVMPQGQAPAFPSVGGNVVAFKPKRTVIRGNEGTGGLAVPGFGEFGNRTLPTALAQNPFTNQLYVGTQFGKIYVLNLDAGNNATLVSTINDIFNSPNTLFNGNPEAGQVGRQVTGIAFDKTAQGGNAVLYVTHSDPEIFEAEQPGDSSVDPASGVLTKLVVNAQGGVVSRTDLVKGLPRSGENHGPNGMAVGPDGWLYVALGGNTNNGAQSEEFSYFPETPLSASVIRVNPAAIGAQTIDASKGARFNFNAPPSPAYTLLGSAADNGTVPGKLELYATGFRNAYDLLWHSNGKLYTAENEANQGFGTTPGPADACPGPAQDQASGPDEFFLVQAGGFHGHPNPSIGQCAEGTGVQPIEVFSKNSSTTGVEEYTSNAFGDLLKGQVLATNYAQGDNVVRLKLNPAGTDVVEKATLASNFSDPVNLLVAKNGAIFVAEHSNAGDSFAQISVLEPIELACPKPGSPNIDSDGDGFLDSDEAANNVNFCNPAEAPADFDGDKLSDLLDPDDDNDGVSDATDRFQRDGSNGAATPIPFLRDFNQSDAGGWFGSGFGGIQLSSKGGGPLAGQVSAGGAGGYLSISATDGTSQGGANNQHNALQQGFMPNGPFEASVSVASPFPGGATANENGGIFFGPDEDNFVRLAVHANGGSPVVELGTEQSGTFTRRAAPALPSGASSVRLMLNGDPSTHRVQVRYRVGADPVQTIGTLTVPASWFAAPAAAGLVTTKGGSAKASIAFIFDDFSIAAGTPVLPPDQGGPPELPPGTLTTPTTPTPPTPPTGRTGGKVKLTIAQMRINQRISSAAIRRVATLEAFLEGRPAPRFPAARPAKFQLTIAQMVINQKIAQAAVRRVDALAARLAGRKPATPRPSSGNATFTLTAAQMLINQRISQAAVRRVNALKAQVDAGARLP